MSYPNLGYNAAEMTYGGAQQPGGYGNQQPGSFGSGQQHPGGYGSGFPGNQQGGYSPYSTPSPYNPAAGGAPPTVNPQVQQWFNTVDRDRSGKISAKELQAALVTGQGRNFSDQACSLMIGMFDKDKSGTIDAAEFQQLFNYVNQWLATYRAYDRDQSGTIEEPELAQAFSQMGFRFSPEFIKFLVTRSDLQNHAKITVDQFIVLCVQVQRFTEAFRQRDKEQQGQITIGFEEFISIALSCSV